MHDFFVELGKSLVSVFGILYNPTIKGAMMMYELVQVGPQSYYIDCPAKIGVYVERDTEVYLIDSGSDKDAGRKVRQILEQQDWSLRGILNTHSMR